MAAIALLASAISGLLPRFGAALMELKVPICASNLAKSALFALQLNDLDSGFENEMWFLAVLVIVGVTVYVINRGPRHM